MYIATPPPRTKSTPCCVIFSLQKKPIIASIGKYKYDEINYGLLKRVAITLHNRMYISKIN